MRGGPDCMDVSADGKTLYVTSRWAKKLSVIDLDSREVVRQINVGVAPMAVVLSRDGKSAFVSNWGGRRPKPKDRTAPSSGRTRR